MNDEVRSALVTEDPTKNAPIGAEIAFSFMTYPPVIPIGSGDLKEWTHFDTSLIGIGFECDGVLRIEGSAVLIGPGIALAAKHVIEPMLDRMMDGSASILAFSVAQHGGIIWRVLQLHFNNTDVAILRIELACDLPLEGLRMATLTTRTPTVGESVMVVGIRSPDAVSLDSSIGLEVRVGVGEVSAVYPTGRDRVLLPHPCIEVKCLSLGGMSGGPAFDKFGHLVGILSTSIEDDHGPSNLSMWWPVSSIPIETCWPPGFITLPTSLIKMAEVKAIAMVRPETIRCGVDDRLSYKPWH